MNRLGLCISYDELERIAENLWSIFESLSSNCSRIDIIFDLYHDSSIKGSERDRRSKHPGILTPVSSADQPLPVELEKFWALSTK